MGFIPDPTPEMGEYRVEVRRESFYIHGEDSFGHNFKSEPAPRHSIYVYRTSGPTNSTNIGVAEILIEDIPKIRAALDLVERRCYGNGNS